MTSLDSALNQYHKIREQMVTCLLDTPTHFDKNKNIPCDILSAIINSEGVEKLDNKYKKIIAKKFFKFFKKEQNILTSAAEIEFLHKYHSPQFLKFCSEMVRY